MDDPTSGKKRKRLSESEANSSESDDEESLGERFYKAAATGDIDTVTYIVFSEKLNPEFDIDYQNDIGNTALYIACAWGFKSTKYGPSSYYEIADFLIKHGADVNIANDENKTPLYIAASWGHTHIVRLLTSQKNINLNVQVPCNMNATPVDIAAYSTRHPDPSAKYQFHSKHHAYYLAMDSMKHIMKTGYWRLFPEIYMDCKMLCDYPAVNPNVDIPNEIKHIIGKYNQFVVVQLLVTAGADINALALSNAARGNQVAMVKFLRRHSEIRQPTIN